jgi:hypothetical protein
MGGAAVGVGPAAPYQARHLMARSIPFELLIDTAARTYDSLGFDRQSLLRFVFNIRAWLRWLRAFLVKGQGRITGHYSMLPGVAIVDETGRIHYRHGGKGLGDYPKPDDVLAHLSAAIGNN